MKMKKWLMKRQLLYVMKEENDEEDMMRRANEENEEKKADIFMKRSIIMWKNEENMNCVLLKNDLLTIINDNDIININIMTNYRRVIYTILVFYLFYVKKYENRE